tara:strand:- start:3048 stop:3236 length:189 start_codon:yes stop_codon:yes gene_type:complete
MIEHVNKLIIRPEIMNDHKYTESSPAVKRLERRERIINNTVGALIFTGCFIFAMVVLLEPVS